MLHKVNLIGDINKHSFKKIRKVSVNFDKGDILDIVICSDGGECDYTFGIIDIIDLLKNLGTVRIVACGKAHSAAADILAFGSPGERWATKNTSIMLHGTISSLEEKESKKHLRYLQFEEKRLKQFNYQLAKVLNKNIEELEADLEKEVWLSAQDAISYGIVDKIL